MSQLIAVEVFFRNQRVKDYVFDQDEVRIGRDPGSDVTLENVGISRLHASLLRQPDGTVRIADRGSANGLLVASKPVKDAVVGPEDPVQIGKFTLRVRPRSDSRGRSGAAERADGPQIPERETIRVDGTRPIELAPVSAAPSSSAASGRNAWIVGALVATLAIGVAIGWIVAHSAR